MSTLAERLSALLRDPILRHEDARRAAQAAEALADLLRASEKAEQILTGSMDIGAGQPTGSVAGMPLQDAAEAVLETAGTPLHAKELGSRIKARGWTHPRGKPSRPDQIVYQLAARLPRFPDRFRRVAPNTFGLVKWDEATASVKPRLGTFKGPGGHVARRIGDHPNEPAEDGTWR
jgi:hypothetical protein